MRIESTKVMAVHPHLARAWIVVARIDLKECVAHLLQLKIAAKQHWFLVDRIAYTGPII